MNKQKWIQIIISMLIAGLYIATAIITYLLYKILTYTPQR